MAIAVHNPQYHTTAQSAAAHSSHTVLCPQISSTVEKELTASIKKFLAQMQTVMKNWEAKNAEKHAAHETAVRLWREYQMGRSRDPSQQASPTPSQIGISGLRASPTCLR